ncbi:MAG: hypothetical protein JSV56_06630, partial [Methanomassiliicoccales archaeon]
MSYIVRVDKDSRWGRELIGTKAFNLQKLMALGTKVPPCSVVTTNSYQESPDRKITESLLNELAREFPKWHVPVIARSSCLAEDTSQSSKAGVFATVFDVSTQSDLEKAVEDVWSSSQGED